MQVVRRRFPMMKLWLILLPGRLNSRRGRGCLHSAVKALSSTDHMLSAGGRDRGEENEVASVKPMRTSPKRSCVVPGACRIWQRLPIAGIVALTLPSCLCDKNQETLCLAHSKVNEAD